MKKVLLLLIAVVTFLSANAAEPTVILSEDFSAFTEGSENEPASTDISSGYTNKLSANLSGWSGKYIYEAGGMLKIGDGGKLVTARYNMSANKGVVKISLRIRSYNKAGMILKVSLGYTTSKQLMVTSGEWQDIEFVTAGGSSLSSVTLEPSYTDGMLIDKIAVTTSADFFPAPEPYQPSNANGTSFTASWKSVTGATAYLLDVYSKKSDNEKEYVMKDEKVTTRSKAVSGLDESKTYFFTVRATNGTATSDYSDEIEVVKAISSIDAPAALPATNVTANGFTANWNAVNDAKSYIVNVIKRKKIQADGEYEILSEDFSGINIGTLNSVEFGTLSGDLNKYTKVPDWYAVNPAFASGYLALAPFGTSAASVTTPLLDLSSDNGHFKTIINMAEMNYGTEYEGGKVTVALTDDDDNIIESKEITLEKGFKDYVIEFSKGTMPAAVMVSYTGSQKIFIDSFIIKQNLKAGYILSAFEQTVETSATSADVTVSEPLSGTVSYAYAVDAVGRTVSSGEIVDIESDSSNIIEVSLSSSIEKNELAKDFKAYRSSKNELAITVSEPCTVEIFSLSGALLNRTTLNEGFNTISIPTSDIVIAKIGSKAIKL